MVWIRPSSGSSGSGGSGADSSAQTLGNGTLTDTATQVGSAIEWPSGSIDFSMLMTAGASPIIDTAYMRPQWSDVDAPSAASDWNDYLREEFLVSGSGVATESQYTPGLTLTEADLPKRFGISITKCRGRWQRLLVYGAATAPRTLADVDFAVTYMRKAS